MDDTAVGGLRADYAVLYEPSLVDEPAALHDAVVEARALIVRNRTQVTAELLGHATNLHVIGRLGVGLDNIDLAACKERGIAVCPATGANAIAVAEYVIGMTLRLLRWQAYGSTARILSGEWPRNDCVGSDASGRTLGLVGFGVIAQAIAVRAKALGMAVAAYDPFVEPGDAAWAGVRNLDLPTLLAQSDVLSLHVPLNDATRHMIDAQALARLKDSAVLINTARGGIVDERALAQALGEGGLAGAALDVLETEPASAESAAHLQDAPRLILTPHIAGITAESNILVSRVTADNVRRVLDAGGSRS